MNRSSGFARVIFDSQFPHVEEGYKELWRWLVMEILPVISFDWKVRVNQGVDGVGTGGTLRNIVTPSDLAFVLTVLEWGASKWSNESNSSGETNESPASGDSVKRGRKKGELGFASQDNIAKFNLHAYALVQVLYIAGREVHIQSWEDAAMMWVNGMRDNDEDDEDDMIEEVIQDKGVVPFVFVRRQQNPQARGRTLVARV